MITLQAGKSIFYGTLKLAYCSFNMYEREGSLNDIQLTNKEKNISYLLLTAHDIQVHCFFLLTH